MPKNVSGSDYVRSTVAMPVTQLNDLTNMMRYRRLASKLERESEMILGGLKITKSKKKNGTGIMKFKYKGRNLFFYYDSGKKLAEALGMVVDEFIKGESNRVRVKGRDVIDVGAYTGDTAICYVANGARHVYALEPYPYFYNIGKVNIKLNGMSKKITMINAGCSGTESKASISKRSTNFANLEKGARKRGPSKRISIMSLGHIVKKYGINNAVLKIDCEGCEYDIISKTDTKVLTRFNEIQIEYHYGYGSLEKRLREAGFRVHVAKPVKKYNFATSSVMTVGFINATKP